MKSGLARGFQRLKRAVMLLGSNFKITLPFSNSRGTGRDCSGIGKDFDKRLSATQSGPSARSGRASRAPPGAHGTTARTRLHSGCQLERLRPAQYILFNDSGHRSQEMSLFAARSGSAHFAHNRAHMFHRAGCVCFWKWYRWIQRFGSLSFGQDLSSDWSRALFGHAWPHVKAAV